MRQWMARRGRVLAGLVLLGGLAGCAAHGDAAATGAVGAAQVPAGTAQTALMARYGERMARQVRSDRVFDGILEQAHVRTGFGVLAVVTPLGFVQKAGVQAGVLPPAVSAAVIRHLLDVNFGRFLPGMPDRPLIFEFPVQPPGVGAAAAGGVRDGSVFRQQEIVLYQPNAVLVARVGSAVPLGAYIKQLDASLAASFDAMPPEAGVTAALVMGVKPGMKSRAWVVTGRNHMSAALIEKIETVAEAVPAVPVQGGPIAFAIIFNVWGGGVPVTDAKHPVPMPRQWFQGAVGNFEVPDGVFARIWK